MPYREPGRKLLDEHEREAVRDDLVLATMMIVLGGLRVAIAVIGHEVFHAEQTVAVAMLVMGMALVVRRR